MTDHAQGSPVPGARGQTQRGSLVEATTNVVVGYAVAVVSQIIVFPWFGIHVRLSDNLAIGGWFSVISIARSYALRRLFNRHTMTAHPSDERLAPAQENQE